MNPSGSPPLFLYGGNVIDPVKTLRAIFADPPNKYRHLAIIHGFLRHYRAGHDSEPRSGTTADPPSLSDRINRWLPKILELGFGGVVANVVPDNAGKNYLEDEEQWEIFLAGFEAADRLGMRIWIYDEEGYPSGAAGGIVLRDHPEYEAQALARSQAEFDAGHVRFRPPTGWLYAVRAQALFDGQHRPVDVTENVGRDGYLELDAPAKCTITRFDARRAFEGTHAALNVHSIRRYINVLNREAVEYFFSVTEGRYFERLRDRIHRVEAVFTDEPSFMAAHLCEVPEVYKGKIRIQDAPDDSYDLLPMTAWDNSLPDEFRKRWGYDLLPEINSLFEGSTARDMRVRHDFHQLQSEIYAGAFFESQQKWLDEKGVAFSGHVLAEEPMVHHVASEGSVMADLKHMQIPGIDMLNSIGESIMDSTHLLTCKYGSSAAHMAGREQVMSETSDWDQRCRGVVTDLIQRRGALALQMAMGVTTITSYYQWKGFDRQEVKNLLDFCARVAAVVRHGTHIADAAVLYPIRTAWAYYKPTTEVLDASLMEEPLKSMDDQLCRIARSIITAGMDFDFIDPESLVQADISRGKLRIGGESYPVLLIPQGAVLGPAELAKLAELVEKGGSAAAFTPCSEFALEDESSQASPAEVIARLRESAPDRVRTADLDSDWIEFVHAAAPEDIKVTLCGAYLAARRSIWNGARFVLVANASKEGASARVEFIGAERTEIWDPWTGQISRVESPGTELELQPYSAMIVTDGGTSHEGN